MGGISPVISEPGLKERVCTGGWRGRGSASGGCAAPVTQSDVCQWHGGHNGATLPAAGTAGWGTAGGKAPERGMVPGGQVQARRGPLRWVKPLPCHPESHHCGRPPRLPKPAAPQRPRVLWLSPAQRGSTGGTHHKSAPPPPSPAPVSQPAQTQLLSKGLISSVALCQPPHNPKKPLLSVFPCVWPCPGEPSP